MNILFNAITACVGGKISLMASPANISVLGNGIMAPVKNISINNGKLPTIITMVVVLQNATNINVMAITDNIVNEQTNNTDTIEPWLLKPNNIANTKVME